MKISARVSLPCLTTLVGCIAVTQVAPADDEIVIGPGPSIVVDGVAGEDEWAGATRVVIRGEAGDHTVAFRRDEEALLFAFTGFTPSSLRVPEVLLQTGAPSDGWSDHTWWFHSSATDCAACGRFDDWTTCVAEAEGWQANNFDDWERPPAAIEMVVPLSLLGLAPAERHEVRIAFVVTDTSGSLELWPEGARVAEPATWAPAVLAAPTP